jgi:molybdate transport system permease protein
MDLFPLWNSLRVAALATIAASIFGIGLAVFVQKTPRILRGVLDVLLTLPLVLPPTVIGFFLLKLLGPHGFIGALFQSKLAMVWYAAVFSSAAVAFPLMYRTMRGALAALDPGLAQAGKTLGLPKRVIFWRITLPNCKSGILAGTVLTFARALGEYGATSMLAGYTPGRTATIATTVYQLWRTGDDAGAYRWVLVNIGISMIVLLALNWAEKSGYGNKRAKGAKRVRG